MKHGTATIIVSTVLVVVVGSAVLFRSMNQPHIKKISDLASKNVSVSYILYGEKGNGKEVEVASSTVLIIQLSKADFEPVHANVATDTPIDIKYEDVGESAAATFTVKGNDSIQVTAKSKNSHKPDFILTVKPH